MTPMLATKGTGAELEQPGWIVDTKYDGWRAVCRKLGDTVTITSRQGKNLTDIAPGVVAALLELPLDEFVLDGELVTLDDSGIAQLPLMLHNNMPRHLVAFDLLEADGYDLRPMRLRERKRLLSISVGTYTDRIRTSRWAHSGPRGVALYRSIVDAGGEGVVCKVADGAYLGGRSSTWVKWKPRYEAQEARRRSA